jgi:hypothetical protein
VIDVIDIERPRAEERADHERLEPLHDLLVRRRRHGHLDG